MKQRSNFHTHTTFCDGKSTAEEIVKAAIARGLTALGFSGHAYTPFDASFCMTKEGTVAYREEILRLKEVYKGQISIFCGLEMDYFSEEDTKAFDFVIGSVHYVEKNGQYFCVDESKAVFLQNVKTGWNEDVYAFAEDYFSLVSQVVEKTNADIIGHFDLITKFNEGEVLFQENNPRYEAAWDGALKALIKTNKPFEINTGAMQRGFRSVPYPSAPILKKIKAYGGEVLITSDCHIADAVDFGFEQAALLAADCGFNQVKFCI